MMKGKFIVIEGMDGTGKHTQATILAAMLSNHGIKAIVTEEPTYHGEIGKLIRRWLNREFELKSLHAQALLYIADRYEHLESVKQSLSEGKWVISARYYHSTYAFQGIGLGLDIDWLKQIHRYVLKPDMLFIIDMPAEESVRRKADERFERLELQRKIRKAYQELAKEEGAIMVDGMKEPVEISAEIWNHIKGVINEYI